MMITLIEQIAKMQAETKALQAGFFDKFKALSLDHKIDLYCAAGENDGAEIFDDFLKKEGYYNLSGVSLTDSMYWERYETMSLSDIFDWLLDEMDDDTLFDPEKLADAIKNGTNVRHVVFRDLLSNNIGRATYDW